MPKKRNTSWSRNKKEKQIVTARLIEISLKVDDYIYKHKLIPVCEAEQYMREVCSYKTQCNQDERSLQVIEKLTGCMKAIIFDHQELRPNIHGENHDSSIDDGGDRADSTSPVYSIADEDRTQLTQIAEARPVDITVANKDIEMIDLSNIDDDDDSIHRETNTATADYPGSRITVEVDIHRVMSSLSLKDVRAPHIISSDVNCSQSILNNFEGVDQMQQNEINIVSKGDVAGGLVSNVADEGKTINVMQAGNNTSNITLGKIPNEQTTPIIELNKTMKTSTSPNKPIIFRNTNSNLKYKTVVQNKQPTSVINTANYSLTMTSNQDDNNIISSLLPVYPITNNNNNETTNQLTNNIPENQRQTCYDSNRTCTVNDSSHKLQDSNHLTQLAQIYKVANPIIVKKVDKLNVNIPTNTFNAAEKENQPIKAAENPRALTNNTAIVHDDSTTIKKKRGRKKKVLDEKDIKPKNKRVYNRAPKSNKENTFTESAKNKIIPIYNEHVINDLSWIENIRYVREINVDENDPKLNLEESFWDNYYLPANWSDNEFM